ncbi:Gfo/Idh/MocA family protein [Diplocloster modestus]|uniref:Gfo/Idh/MocA family oxidoreductase n=1 Tax=Diplocloster modestus TaxID=2850322 RepID=A0ABS6KCU5_9FIRM|nr:Gfo/Idh/MocA family oxidoreductase [Diplocloster modestus]MBU9728341.1 Gfo/Idh/MocA family oxidoreductase [Diplocloster modestus]
MSGIVRWGIIGAGGIARRRTIPALNLISNARVAAVMDKNGVTLSQLREEYGIENCYQEEEALLGDPEVDAVYIASPVKFHLEQARRVLDAGKHLLIEKPVALDAGEAEELLRYASGKELCTGVGMVMRFHGGHESIRKIVRDGLLGDIVSCRAQLTCWFPKMDGNWRQVKAIAGGGALTDMGIHCIDLMRYLLGDEVEKVCGMVDHKTFDYEVEDSVSAVLRMRKGADCFINANFNIPDEAAHCPLEIYGTKGSVLAYDTIGQDGEGDIFLTVSDSEKGYASSQVRSGTDGGRKLPYEQVNIYARQLEEFSACILEKRPARTTLADACQTMKVVDAIYRSSLEERTVYLD